MNMIHHQFTMLLLFVAFIQNMLIFLRNLFGFLKVAIDIDTLYNFFIPSTIGDVLDKAREIIDVAFHFWLTFRNINTAYNKEQHGLLEQESWSTTAIGDLIEISYRIEKKKKEKEETEKKEKKKKKFRVKRIRSQKDTHNEYKDNESYNEQQNELVSQGSSNTTRMSVLTQKLNTIEEMKEKENDYSSVKTLQGGKIYDIHNESMHDRDKRSDLEPCVLWEHIFNLVERIKEKSFFSNNNDLSINPFDSLKYLAEGIITKQKEFADANIPSYVDIGYHYTNCRNLPLLSMHGLLTKKEQKGRDISPNKNNKQTFGDGIYTCNNPYSFTRIGSTGFLVARLQGNTTRVPYALRDKEDIPEEINTIIGDKKGKGGSLDNELWPETDQYHEIVLRSSAQCLPLIRYDRAILDSEEGVEIMQELELSTQNILDELINKGCRRQPMGKITRSMYKGYQIPLPPLVSLEDNSAINNFNNESECELYYEASKSIPNIISSYTLNSLSNTIPNGIFPILQKNFSLDACYRYLFPNQDISCSDKAKIEESKRLSPSGTMTVSLCENKYCRGYENLSKSTIQINYSMMGYGASTYHGDNTCGVYDSGKEVTAYLPSTLDGEDLLKRLKYAFLHGLTFTGKPSLEQTSAATIQCTWASIPHKTQVLGGGDNGYPDVMYIKNCNKVLDDLKVPSSQKLKYNGTIKMLDSK